jgi:hypothetical protein
VWHLYDKEHRETKCFAIPRLEVPRFITILISMKHVTKPLSKPRICTWCRKRFKPKTIGRPALFCSPNCRQRAYEKRRWLPYSLEDALALSLLRPGARRKIEEEVRHEHMLELIMKGTVPLRDPDQIDGILDKVKDPERMPLLRKIEAACQRRSDENALATLASWRLSRQHARRSGRPPRRADQ